MTLKALREQCGLTQRQVADRCAWQKQRISALEVGLIPSPRMATLDKLASALGVDPIVVVSAIRATVQQRIARAS